MATRVFVAGLVGFVTGVVQVHVRFNWRVWCSAH